MDFANKADEELEEWRDEIIFHKKPTDASNLELADLILVISAYVIHNKINIFRFIVRAVIKNERRAEQHKKELASKQN